MSHHQRVKCMFLGRNCRFPESPESFRSVKTTQGCERGGQNCWRVSWRRSCRDTHPWMPTGSRWISSTITLSRPPE